MKTVAIALLATMTLAELRLARSVVDEILCDLLMVKTSRSADPVAGFRERYAAALRGILDNQFDRFACRGLRGEIDEVMAYAERAFGAEVAERIRPEAEKYLRSAFMAGARLRAVPSAIQILWDRPREEAVNWLVEHDRFWIGRVFPQHLAERFKHTLIAGHEAGLGRDDIARQLRRVITGTPEDAGGLEHYRRVASANITRARNWGSAHSLEAAGIERYVWRAAGDERMCERCGWFDGQRFEVEPAMTLARQAIARSPEAIESLAPWPSEDAERGDFYIETSEGREYLRGHGTEWLQAHGLGMPPLHANCRCVVVAEV